MFKPNLLFRACLLSAVLATAPASAAVVVRDYDFVFTNFDKFSGGDDAAPDNEVIGRVAFRYDDAAAFAPTLEAFELDINGAIFDTVDVALANFASPGDFQQILLGNNCATIICSVNSGSEQFFLTLIFATDWSLTSGYMVYALGGPLYRSATVAVPVETEVPEPASLGLLGLGLGAVALGARRRRTDGATHTA